MSETFQNAIHDVVQRESSCGKEGSLLTGWAIVAEWMDADGERWLSRAHAPSTAPWAARGMWHEALYGHWPISDPVEDEDDD